MKNLNPLALIDAVLADWASERVRRSVHALILLGASAVTIWLAAEGDWKVALLSLAAVLYAGSNHANTPDSALPTDSLHGGTDETLF